MTTQSSLSTPSISHLRERCLAEGVAPGDDDLEAVAAFLDTILPALGRIEASLAPDASVAGLFLPEAVQGPSAARRVDR